MPAYRDEKKKTWTSKFQYKDWMGNKKWICKRGFKTKRDALEFENNYLLETAGNLEMRFEDFAKIYKEEMFPRIKYSTSITKRNIIDKHITPYFGSKKLSDITPKDIMKWQNTLIKYVNPKTGKPFTKSYLKTVHNQLSAMLNFAVKFYGLSHNPARKVGNMGSEKEITINFWTEEEYSRFRAEIMEEPLLYYCFEVLYWTGIRVGELLALTPEDLDLCNETLNINKTYHYIDGKELITDPKTKKSKRIIKLPGFLIIELQEYLGMVYGIERTDRLFPTSKSHLNRKLKQYAKRVNLKPIRVHDMRHSHVSLLINLGYSAVAIADRLGHESIQITYKYSHLFPSVQSDMANSLNEISERLVN